MSFYFEEFPFVKYDLKKNGKSEFLTNLTLRFKILEVLKTIESGYYSYSIPDGERAFETAFKTYEDPKLTWIIYLVNNIYDPEYDWPLSSVNLNKFIKSKYGSISSAQAEIHEYRKIISEGRVLFDGEIIAKKTFSVDETTYNTLADSEKEAITKYAYEFELNEAKRNIKLVSPRNVARILADIREVFNA
jgi:hypothetical protein